MQTATDSVDGEARTSVNVQVRLTALDVMNVLAHGYGYLVTDGMNKRDCEAAIKSVLRNDGADLPEYWTEKVLDPDDRQMIGTDVVVLFRRHFRTHFPEDQAARAVVSFIASFESGSHAGHGHTPSGP